MTATAADGDIVVRRMSAADIDPVVHLQVSFLAGSIITELGPAFLAAFHAAALQHPQTRAFVAADAAERLAGFAIASADVHAFNAHVKPRVVMSMARALASPRRLRLAWNIARGVFEHGPQPPIPAELLLLVVDATVRRRGIGQCLLNALEAAFRAEALSRYRVAVRSHLAVARAFYEATGFEAEQELQVLGEPMTYLTKRVPL